MTPSTRADAAPRGRADPAVLLWVPRFWPATGGTELHTHALAGRLAARAPVEVITHCDATETARRSLAEDVCRTPDASLVDGGVRIHRLGLAGARSAIPSRLARRYHHSRLARLAFGALFARHVGPAAREVAARCDLVHFVYNGLTDAAVLAERVAARRGVPFVLTPNVVDTSGPDSAWNSLRLRRLYRAAARLIALTEHEADWLARHGADRDRIRVVPYGPILAPDPDGARGRRELGVGDAPFVLFLGRVVPVKGYDLLLGASARIWADFPDARIVLMGPATPASREAVAAVGDARLSLVEGADQRLKSDALAGCDLMCLPSRAESLGVVYIEAFFNARPVVCLDLPVLRRVVAHGRHGLLVGESAEALAGAIGRLLGDPALRARMGERAERDARARYDWPAVRDAVAAVHAEALEASGR